MLFIRNRTKLIIFKRAQDYTAGPHIFELLELDEKRKYSMKENTLYIDIALNSNERINANYSMGYSKNLISENFVTIVKIPDES